MKEGCQLTKSSWGCKETTCCPLSLLALTKGVGGLRVALAFGSLNVASGNLFEVRLEC